MEKPKFIYVTHINATPEKVWAALTEPEFTRQYWNGQLIESDWTPGATVKFIKPDGGVKLKGEVLRVEPPKILVYTWDGDSYAAAGPGEGVTRVTFEITVAFNITRLTVTHEDFRPGSELFPKISQGWPAVLCSLKSLLETGKPLAFDWKC